jgi:alpha-D-ribose 1-methylphosphonate 5-triphosphate diphosphatase PhnM
MTTRKIRPVFDDLTSQNSFRLNVSLADFLPNTRQVDSAHEYVYKFANKDSQGSTHAPSTE